MNTNMIFTGNLIYNNKSLGTYVFLKYNENYVFLDEVNTSLDLLKLKANKLNLKTFDTDSSKQCYIEEKSLALYYENNKHRTLKKIKNDYLSDSRNQTGIQN
jgi:hypothetical protein